MLYSQSTVPGIDLSGGSRLAASLDVSRFTERGMERAVGSMLETWRSRLNAVGISEPAITAREDDSFDIVVPFSADTGLVGRMIQESGAITLHLFKDGAEVQALRQRIDDTVRERALAESAGLSSFLSSITVEDGIADIVVRENNLEAVRAMLADSTVLASIRAFNLANPPAGAFAWATEPVERGGDLYYPLYFINQDVDLNAQPLASAVVDDASVTAGRGAYAVRLFLEDAGRESLANLSSANAGNRVAIKMKG